MTDKDINDFINTVRNKIKENLMMLIMTEIINDLKWIAYDTIVDFIKNNKVKQMTDFLIIKHFRTYIQRFI